MKVFQIDGELKWNKLSRDKVKEIECIIRSHYPDLGNYKVVVFFEN